MSQENVTGPGRGVRIPLVPETRRHRTLDERIVVRFPSLGRWLAAAWARLPRQSRLRRAMLVRRVRQGYAAANRRDFELLVTGLDPDIEFRPVEAFPDAGGVFHGHQGYLEPWRHLLGGFEDFRLDPHELLDCGDRVVVKIELSGRGAGSGAPHSQQAFQVFTLRRGLVVRQDDFRVLSEALEAVGLSE
jgi:hypothetical protein